MDPRNDMTEAAVAAREEAATLGRKLGERLVEQAREEIDGSGIDPSLDPYLEGLIYINAAQVIANEGRRIAGLDFGKQDKDLEGKRGGGR